MAYFKKSLNVRYVEDYDVKTAKHTYTFVGPCRKCGVEQKVTVEGKELFKYNQGEYIQNAFQNLDAGQREWCISGTCGPCFDKMFKEDE